MKNNKMKTQWFGIELDNPIILSALTLISHKQLKKHIEYYKKASQSGVGAIVVESFVPIEFGSSDIAFTQNDLIPVETGLKERQFMSFALSGPPYPNLSSIKYGINLIEGICKQITDTPIIGSIIANFGNETQILKAVEKMMNLGVKGVELNFSCPNVLSLSQSYDEKSNAVYRQNPSLSIVRTIKENVNLGVSLKLTPSQAVNSLEKGILEMVDSITYSNAYLGLAPPSLVPPFSSPFGRGDKWAYSGVYGPFERLLTYRMLAEIKNNKTYKDIHLSIAGGIIEGKNIIEALLLGADTVQIGSGVLWKGFDVIKEAINTLNNFMKQNSYNTIEEFRGKSLKYVHSCVSAVEDYQCSGLEKPSNQRTEMTITDKCIQCYRCLSTSCIATDKKANGQVTINKDLCSGCGWCQVICPISGAIERLREDK